MSIRIGFGLPDYPFEDAAGYFRWIELLDAERVDSVWQSERLISDAPYLEPLIAMATIAARTERIKFGMNTAIAPLRDPLLLAKQCATIDFLSGGRLLPMFGVGYPEAPEWNAIGQSPERRGTKANEIFELLTRLWSEESVTFEGEFFRYKDATIAPRPVQQPMPLWIGGRSKAAIRRTARFGTGWIGGINTPQEIGEAIAAIKTEAERVGRSIDPDHYGTTVVYRFGGPEDDAVSRSALIRGEGVDLSHLVCFGTEQTLIEQLREFVAVGVSKFVLFPVASGETDVFDQTRRVLDSVRPEIES